MQRAPLNINLAADGAISGLLATGFPDSKSGAIANVCDECGRTIGVVNVTGLITPLAEDNAYNVTISFSSAKQISQDSASRTFYGIGYYNDALKALTFAATDNKIRSAA